MRHLKTYRELKESSSAGSQETNGTTPFKYSKIYDPRIGYNKTEFISDLNILYKEKNNDEKRDLCEVIKKFTGIPKIDSIQNLRTLDLNKLIKMVEEFLDSKADYVLNIYPDGYVLCFENIITKLGKYDIYFHPNKDIIKTVKQTGSTLEPEKYIKLDTFSPLKYNIKEKDFLETIKKCKLLFRQKEISDIPPQ